MSRYVKSISDTRKLTKSLNELKEEFSYHKAAIEKNNKELEKINHQVEVEKQKEVKVLQEKLKKLELETRWVENSEPAVKVTSDYLLKKLDVL